MMDWPALIMLGIIAIAALSIAYVAVCWWLEIKHRERKAAIAKIELEANLRRARAMLNSGSIFGADKAGGQ